MFSEERREKILEKVETNGRVLAKDLAEEYNVSIDSIRRDLTIMEEEGLLKRTHGGAIPNQKARKSPQPRTSRYGTGDASQQAIAKAAVEYIRKGDAIFIGGASIHYVMMEHLPRTFPFTVVTNSVEIAYHLRDLSNVETYLIGGLMKESGNMTDGLANEFAKQFTVDVNFLTAGGISEKGISTATPEVALFHKTVLSNARRNIGLMESVKIGESLFSRMTTSLSVLDVLITDDEVIEGNLDMLKSHGVRVRLVQGDE
ncbi:DeoR/GlpR family DNA-binding transcription regulator [Rossellomorea aquimaris]|uniref:DeoR/GlpR family DNA-binding transcription regulator n=1 Tax=Rossellomorea aquimaris TaxID=189382 RepID=UPI001CD47DA7|nr:DeoR/GlpR family DNA-binding transcription regulator [Rossellomorea aquimaris]MCA1053801.1 DeoR/GlpR family DNA-binding transcription regulator [Rossellomorea aquimaris]